MTFKSKMDWWAGPLLIGIPLVFLVQLIFGLVDGNTMLAGVGGGGLAFLVILYGAIVWPLRYTLTDDTLVIQFGYARSRIPYDVITAVEPHKGLLSGPALSSDRLRIARANGLSVQISPHDQAAFLRALAEKAEGLVVDGDRVVRAPKPSGA